MPIFSINLRNIKESQLNKSLKKRNPILTQRNMVISIWLFKCTPSTYFFDLDVLFNNYYPIF